jgi:hypothetical protein
MPGSLVYELIEFNPHVRTGPTALTVGVQQLCTGTYRANWEHRRFVVLQPPRRLTGLREVPCDLVDESGRSLAPPGAHEPSRHGPDLQLCVEVRVTPLEQGRFGHRGALRWRLRVDEWIDVWEAAG